MQVGQIHTDRTTRLYVPIGFFLTGLGWLVVALAVLFVTDRPGWRPPASSWPVVALVHGFTLGFLTLVMMGALYQLTPVLTNRPPIAPRWSLIQGLGYLGGLGAFLWGLEQARPIWIAVGGSAVLGALIGFAGLIGSRVIRRGRWTIPQVFIATAVGYLVLTAVMGSWMAWGFLGLVVTPVDPLWIHFSVGMGGWMGFLLMGVSYRLWLMFLPSRRKPRWWQWTYGLQQGAVIAGVVSGYEGWHGGLVLAWGLGMLAWATWTLDMLGFVRGHRLFRHEPALWLPAAGTIFAAFAWIAGLASWLQWVHGWRVVLVAYLMGWLGLSFLGFVQKIVAFLLWLHRYSHVHGQGKMPRLNDIFPPRWSYGIALLTLSGMVLWVGGWSIPAFGVAHTGMILFGVGVAALILAIFAALLRKLQPRPLEGP